MQAAGRNPGNHSVGPGLQQAQPGLNAVKPESFREIGFSFVGLRKLSPTCKVCRNLKD
jgi:hypothetical protein